MLPSWCSYGFDTVSKFIEESPGGEKGGKEARFSSLHIHASHLVTPKSTETQKEICSELQKYTNLTEQYLLQAQNLLPYIFTFKFAYSYVLHRTNCSLYVLVHQQVLKFSPSIIYQP
jgi:hypothetical protein